METEILHTYDVGLNVKFLCLSSSRQAIICHKDNDERWAISVFSAEGVRIQRLEGIFESEPVDGCLVRTELQLAVLCARGFVFVDLISGECRRVTRNFSLHAREDHGHCIYPYGDDKVRTRAVHLDPDNTRPLHIRQTRTTMTVYGGPTFTARRLKRDFVEVDYKMDDVDVRNTHKSVGCQIGDIPRDVKLVQELGARTVVKSDSRRFRLAVYDAQLELLIPMCDDPDVSPSSYYMATQNFLLYRKEIGEDTHIVIRNFKAHTTASIRCGQRGKVPVSAIQTPATYDPSQGDNIFVLYIAPGYIVTLAVARPTVDVESLFGDIKNAAFT